MSNNKDNQSQLINFTLQELTRIINDVRSGKEPQMSPTLQKLAEEMEAVKDSKRQMTEEEVKQWTDKIIEKVYNKNTTK
jgi:hypothetical protein